MIILNKKRKTQKNVNFKLLEKNFPCFFSLLSFDQYKAKEGFQFSFPCKFKCSFHSTIEEKRHTENSKDFSFFKDDKKNRSIFFFKNKKLEPCNFNFINFKTQKSSSCLFEIRTADTLSRKKRKTNMQISGLKKITCSYTQKNLVFSPTELSIPMIALTFITGQNCAIVWASTSVSSWKLRKNSVIGCKVTLRRKAALLFLDKFYIYGREGLIEKKKNFLNNFPFYFGCSKNKHFLELQKSNRFSSSFSGFSVSIN